MTFSVLTPPFSTRSATGKQDTEEYNDNENATLPIPVCYRLNSTRLLSGLLLSHSYLLKSVKLSKRHFVLMQVQVQVQPQQQQIQESTSQQQSVQQNTEQQIVQVCTFLSFVCFVYRLIVFHLIFDLLNFSSYLNVSIFRCRSRASSKARCWVRSSKCPLVPISSFKV